MITVFTPSYNRATLLSRLYNSLLKQSNIDFEWLVVDDGSTDNTKDVVQSWINENKIKIRYIFQNNSGKYIAFNTGVVNALGDLFFCVDSDDYLPENAIDLIYCIWNNNSCKNISGIIALKSYINNDVISGRFPENINCASAFELDNKFNCGGERSLVYQTDVLKNNLFPVINGEKFVTECVIYDKIDKTYNMIVSNEILTVCEYQKDGLTSNIFNNMLNNPTGYKIFYNQRIDMAYTFRQKIGYAIRYNAFKILSNDMSFNYNGKHKFLVLLTKPLGFLLTKYYRLKKRLK